MKIRAHKYISYSRAYSTCVSIDTSQRYFSICMILCNKNTAHNGVERLLLLCKWRWTVRAFLMGVNDITLIRRHADIFKVKYAFVRRFTALGEPHLKIIDKTSGDKFHPTIRH